MGFDPQAFTAAFMNKLSEGIDERGKEAKELFTEELEKADRNVALFKTRLANMNAAKNIADIKVSRDADLRCKDLPPILESLGFVVERNDEKVLSELGVLEHNSYAEMSEDDLN